MSATKPRTSSFSRNFLAANASQIPGLKHGPNGTMFISSGIPDLDKILGGGFSLGSLVMVMEDAEAPHHMLLLRNFMSQGLVHNQPLLYASPSKDPRQFLGTLPSPRLAKDDKSGHRDPDQEKGLRIAWQYKKYFDENQQGSDIQDGKHGFCNEFDLKKPLERQFLSGKRIDCISIQDSPNLVTLHDRCATFLSQFPRVDGELGTDSSSSQVYFTGDWPRTVLSIGPVTGSLMYEDIAKLTKGTRLRTKLKLQNYNSNHNRYLSSDLTSRSMAPLTEYTSFRIAKSDKLPSSFA